MTEMAELTAVIDKAVDQAVVPGALVELRADGDTVHRSAHGVLDAESGFRLAQDNVFWLASLSKLIGAVAILLLADQRHLRLTDHVSSYIPEFATPGRVRVLRAGSPSPFAVPFGPPPDPLPQFDVIPAERELTIHDLLTHTGGLQSIFVWNPEYRAPSETETLAEYVPSLGGLVRDFQPGQRWAYSNAASFDVLSRIIEVVSGQDLSVFLKEQVLDPLDMESTGFGRGADDGATPLPPPLLGDATATGRMYHSISAGLWSTPTDLLNLAEMLRNGGLHCDRRVLSATSVARMTTNQVGDLCPGLNGRTPAPGIGFGLSVAVIEDPAAAGEALPAGTYGWDGVGTRRVWVCPDRGWSMFFYAPDLGLQRNIETAVVAAL